MLNEGKAFSPKSFVFQSHSKKPKEYTKL